ncbi:MAG: hypothetical protein F6J87_01605 [Spirulina sp. SIO3F2]|nr:hypothetical protein [Spirulina sp. SIO3F2]
MKKQIAKPTWQVPTTQAKTDDKKRKTNQHNPIANFAPNALMDSVTLAPASSLPIQPKLTIGQVGDQYEQEADRITAQAVHQINTPTAKIFQLNAPTIQEQPQLPDISQQTELQPQHTPLIQRYVEDQDLPEHYQTGNDQANPAKLMLYLEEEKGIPKDIAREAVTQYAQTSSPISLHDLFKLAKRLVSLKNDQLETDDTESSKFYSDEEFHDVFETYNKESVSDPYASLNTTTLNWQSEIFQNKKKIVLSGHGSYAPNVLQDEQVNEPLKVQVPSGTNLVMWCPHNSTLRDWAGRQIEMLNHDNMSEFYKQQGYEMYVFTSGDQVENYYLSPGKDLEMNLSSSQYFPVKSETLETLLEKFKGYTIHWAACREVVSSNYNTFSSEFPLFNYVDFDSLEGEEYKNKYSSKFGIKGFNIPQEEDFELPVSKLQNIRNVKGNPYDDNNRDLKDYLKQKTQSYIPIYLEITEKRIEFLDFMLKTSKSGEVNISDSIIESFDCFKQIKDLRKDGNQRTLLQGGGNILSGLSESFFNESLKLYSDFEEVIQQLSNLRSHQSECLKKVPGTYGAERFFHHVISPLVNREYENSDLSSKYYELRQKHEELKNQKAIQDINLRSNQEGLGRQDSYTNINDIIEPEDLVEHQNRETEEVNQDSIQDQQTKMSDLVDAWNIFLDYLLNNQNVKIHSKVLDMSVLDVFDPPNGFFMPITNLYRESSSNEALENAKRLESSVTTYRKNVNSIFFDLIVQKLEEEDYSDFPDIEIEIRSLIEKLEQVKSRDDDVWDDDE